MPDSRFAAIVLVKKTKRAGGKNPEEQPVMAAAILEEVASEEAELPENRVIRKRFAAKTIGVHVSALPPEFRTLETRKRADSDDYLRKHEIPDRVRVTTADGSERLLTREEAWQLADAQAAQIESGLAKGWLKWATEGASLGQGPYADYLRPTLDFSAFYRDSIKAHDAKLKAMTYKGLKLGPSIIAYDTVSAVAMTTAGYAARGADLAASSVLTDIATTATYEGASALAAAKLGTIAGGKAFAYTVALPIPGARIVGLVAGFAVGATTAIFAKKGINLGKDKAVELGHEALEAGGAAPKPYWPSRE